MRPSDAFFCVQLLLQCEHMGIEVLLQLLICKVDAQLFERVELEYLKSIDVQDANLPVVTSLSISLRLPSMHAFETVKDYLASCQTFFTSFNILGALQI